ncbi:MAG TPA: hypothetical protein VH416_09465 [Gaiellaceae bacterium]|jgi:hypothetical protein
MLEQVVLISPRATAFTAVCDLCVELDAIAGWSGSSFAGRLDLDLSHGLFLCRRGHSVRVEREPELQARGSGSAAA